jgi:hypothetical protein
MQCGLSLATRFQKKNATTPSGMMVSGEVHFSRASSRIEE